MRQDVQIAQEVLITGEKLKRIAVVSGVKRVMTVDGRRLLGVQTSGTVRFAVPRANLEPFNVLAVNVRLAEPFDGSMVTRFDYTTRSAGMETNDSRFSVLHFNQPRQWRGWQRILIPAENLVAVGFPDGWKHVSSITLDIHSREDCGTVIFGDIELLQVDRGRGARMSDADLLDALDLDRPDMRRVAAHARASRVDQAITAFAAAMRRAKRPARGEAINNAHYAVPTADDLCRHQIQGQQLPKQIDWRVNPIGYLEWNHAFNRHTWMAALANGFFDGSAAQQRRYARKLDYFIHTWCEQNPEPIGHNGGLDPAWETLSTSCRINWA